MPELLEVYHTGEFWRGPLYPIGRIGSPVVIGEDIDEVFSSIIQILNTRRGERIMYPEFGSDLGPILWEPNDLFLQQQVRVELIRSLTVWEPRVQVVSVVFDSNPNLKNLGILVVSIQIRLVNNPRLEQIVNVPISSQGALFSNEG
jgi:phage baseplate assembly protein W